MRIVRRPPCPRDQMVRLPSLTLSIGFAAIFPYIWGVGVSFGDKLFGLIGRRQAPPESSAQPATTIRPLMPATPPAAPPPSPEEVEAEQKLKIKRVAQVFKFIREAHVDIPDDIGDIFSDESLSKEQVSLRVVNTAGFREIERLMDPPRRVDLLLARLGFHGIQPSAEFGRVRNANYPDPAQRAQALMALSEFSALEKQAGKRSEEIGLHVRSVIGHVAEHAQFQWPSSVHAILVDHRLSAEERNHQIYYHPDFKAFSNQVTHHYSEFSAPIEERRAYKLTLVGEALAMREKIFEENRDSWGDCSDNRGRRYFDDELGHRDLGWTPTYMRIMGSFDEKERLVLLYADALEYLEEADADLVTHLRVSAFAGSGKAQIQWQNHFDWKPHIAVGFRELVEKLYPPPSFSETFDLVASRLLRLIKSEPDHPLAQWARPRLRSHSTGWATER